MDHTLIIYVIILLDGGGDGENDIDVNDDSVTAARNEVSFHIIAYLIRRHLLFCDCRWPY